MSIKNNTTSLQELLEKVNNLPNAGSSGVDLPELANEGAAEDLMLGKELINDEGNVVIGAFTIDSELTAQDDLISQIITALEGKASSSKPILQNKTVDPSTSSNVVKPDSGYDGLSQVTVNAMTTATQAIPSIGIDSDGKITATTTQAAGYVSAGTKSATKQLTTQAAKTITPSTSSQTAVAKDVYTIGAVTVEAIPSQYIIPSGTLTITANGTHDVKNYASATVNVAGSGGGDNTILNGLLDGTLSTYTDNTLTQVRDGLFMKFSNLTQVDIPVCTRVYPYGFQECSKLTSLSFPECTQVDDNAFYLCSRVTTISFPKCKTVNGQAFARCSSLTTVNMPSCTTVAMSAFASCAKLTSINFPVCTTVNNYAFNTCSLLTDINMPALQTLNNSAFSNCYALSTISLPVATVISAGAFMKCFNLKSLYLMGSSLCALKNSNAFTSTPIGGYSTSAGTFGSIYVPASMLASYKAATNWTYFSSRMVGV